MDPLLHIVLHQPLIPQNTGNIGRLTTANGLALHLIAPLGFDISAKAVRRAGLDYWKHARVQVHESFSACREALPRHRFIAFTKGAATRYTDFAFRAGDALLFGQETKGLPRTLLEEPDIEAVHLPLRNRIVRSLNLANAVAIGSYEAMRQLDFPEALDPRSLHYGAHS